MCHCTVSSSEYQHTEGNGNRVYKDVARSCEVDLDLHRFQCTKCDEIGYYSDAAKNYYENGITSNILGLKG